MTFTPGIALVRSVVPSVDPSSETITSSCSATWAQTDSNSVRTELQRLNAGIAILNETCFTEHSEITGISGPVGIPPLSRARDLRRKLRSRLHNASGDRGTIVLSVGSLRHRFAYESSL